MPRVSAELTDTARSGWDRACGRHGTTLTALVESIGQALLEGDAWVPAEVIDRARAIDRERHSRR